MSLTPEELEHAHALKARAAEIEGLEGISDFEIAQHAIVAKGNIDKAINRMGRLQKQRQRYAQSGMTQEESIKFMADKAPGLMCGTGVDAEGRVVISMKYSGFKAKNFLNESEWIKLMSAFVALLDAMCCDFESTRNGVVFISDSEGMGWESFSVELEKHAAEVYQESYPIRIKSMVMVESPFIIHAMIALVKVFLSKKIRDSIILTKRAKFLEESAFPPAVLPPSLGGTFNEDDFLPILSQRLATRARAIEEFSL